MARLHAPIPYFGGKHHLAPKIISLFPEHRTYVEVFGGAASVLFAKGPSPVEVYNDVNSDVVNLFRVLRDPEKHQRLIQLAGLTPFSREELYTLRSWDEAAEQDDVLKAWRFYVVARMAFSAQLKQASWGYTINGSSRGMAQATSRYLNAIDMLPAIHERLMRVQIEHDDFRKVIPRFDTPETLFYCDPPYVPETRRSGGYADELVEEDHRELVDLLLGIKGKVILSGYANPVYEVLEQRGWYRMDIPVVCHSAGRTRGTGILGAGSAKAKQSRVESLWLNYRAKEARAA